MIAFGCSITRPDVYRRCAEPGIRRVAEPDSEVYALDSVGSIFESYNQILDIAAAREDLEALVLVHQDTSIDDGTGARGYDDAVSGLGRVRVLGLDEVDSEKAVRARQRSHATVPPPAAVETNGREPSGFCQKVRKALGDPEVGVVGCVGAIGVRSIAWWEGSVALASFLHRYEEHGGGDLPAFSWWWDEAPPYARTGEVDTLDGFLLVLSPWVVRNIRFDESLGQLHGYDFDFCLQVRQAGRKVVTADFRAIHSHALQPFSDPEHWIEAHMVIAEKWDGRMPGVGEAAGTWKQRARRAEAECEVARTIDYSNALIAEARVRELERALAEARGSTSWRITAPLRLLSRLLRRAR
jgi:Glycosyltransferase like family